MPHATAGRPRVSPTTIDHPTAHIAPDAPAGFRLPPDSGAVPLQHERAAANRLAPTLPRARVRGSNDPGAARLRRGGTGRVALKAVAVAELTGLVEAPALGVPVLERGARADRAGDDAR